MAGTGIHMHITKLDDVNDLYAIEEAIPAALVAKILSTSWLDLPWIRQEGQESWARRRIEDDAIAWLPEWHLACSAIWQSIADALEVDLEPYGGTAWWLDEPGFTCALHTDGEMPGSMQLTWIGARPDLGTCFYWYKDPATLRHRFPMKPNSGYVMIKRVDASGYRPLAWHGMLTPVPRNTFRLTSYSWLVPRS